MSDILSNPQYTGIFYIFNGCRGTSHVFIPAHYRTHVYRFRRVFMVTKLQLSIAFRKPFGGIFYAKKETVRNPYGL